MSIPTLINGQITDAVTQAHQVGGDDALAVITDLVEGIAQSLTSATQSDTAMDDLSTSIENAEATLHEIIARLVNNKD